MGMKVEGGLFMLVGALFAVTDAAYWYFSHDPTGTVALGLLAGMSLLIGYYMITTGRRTGRRVEDDPDAEISEGAGYYGFFSPYSWWPLWTAAAAAMTGVGVAIAWWLAIAGIMSVILAALGMVFEYYRGVHAH